MRPTSTTLLWLVLVFASGVVMGVAGHRYFWVEPAVAEAPQRPSRDQIRQDYLSKMRTRVGVTEEQIAKIVEILDRGRVNADAHKASVEKEIRQMQGVVDAEIRSVLTPEQLERHDEWRKERRREREKREAERRKAEGR